MSGWDQGSGFGDWDSSSSNRKPKKGKGKGKGYSGGQTILHVHKTPPHSEKKNKKDRKDKNRRRHSRRRDRKKRDRSSSSSSSSNSDGSSSDSDDDRKKRKKEKKVKKESAKIEAAKAAKDTAISDALTQQSKSLAALLDSRGTAGPAVGGEAAQDPSALGLLFEMGLVKARASALIPGLTGTDWTTLLIQLDTGTKEVLRQILESLGGPQVVLAADMPRTTKAEFLTRIRARAVEQSAPFGAAAP